MRILITGASSGIGETVARRLSADGHRVALMARRQELVRTIAADLEGAIAVPGDVAIVEDCEAAVRETVAAFGGLDILVNGAGTWVEAPLHEATYDQIRAFVDTDQPTQGFTTLTPGIGFETSIKIFDWLRAGVHARLHYIPYSGDANRAARLSTTTAATQMISNHAQRGTLRCKFPSNSVHTARWDTDACAATASCLSFQGSTST